MTLYEVKYEAKCSLKGRWLKAVLSLVVYSIISQGLIFIPFIGPIINLIVSIPLSVGLMFMFLSIAKKEDYKNLDFLKATKAFFGRAWGMVFSILLKMWKPLLLLVISIIILVVNMVSTTSSSILSAAQSATDKYYYATQSGLDYMRPSTPSASTKTASSSTPLLSLLSTVLSIVSLVWILAKGLLYSLAYYILLENPAADNKSILEKSEQLMFGNRLKLLLLPLSFIGWVLLIDALVFIIIYALISLLGIVGITTSIVLFISFISTLFLNVYMQVSTACFYTKLSAEKK